MDQDIFALFIGLVAVVLGSLVVLIPIIGLTARFTLRSWIDRALALMEARQAMAIDAAPEQIQRLEQRIALLEQEVQLSARQLQEVTERAEFYDRLGSPRE